MRGKSAIITGSATGLGYRTAIELARLGVNVAVNHVKSGEKAAALAALLQSQYGVKAVSVQGDVSQSSDAGQVAIRAGEALGTIDILINNAGPFIKRHVGLADTPEEEWRQMIDGNLSSAFYLSRLVIPGMRERGWGRIVNIGFEKAETAPGWIHHGAYAAAKTGLVSLTKTLAMEEAENGVTVNMVCPVDIKGAWKEAGLEEARAAAEGPVPVRRPGTGEDIGRTIAFLCGPDSDFITGAVIAVTGDTEVLARHRAGRRTAAPDGE